MFSCLMCSCNQDANYPYCEVCSLVINLNMDAYTQLGPITNYPQLECIPPTHF